MINVSLISFIHRNNQIKIHNQIKNKLRKRVAFINELHDKQYMWSIQIKFRPIKNQSIPLVTIFLTMHMMWFHIRHILRILEAAYNGDFFSRMTKKLMAKMSNM